MARYGSSVSAALNNLSPASRKKFIEYLIDPKRQQFPEPALREAIGEVLKYTFTKDEEREAAVNIAVGKLERALRDTSPHERIPIIERTLTADSPALKDRADFLPIIRSFLGFGNDSLYEKLLISFLEVVPEHERSVSLAYLISQAGENKEDIAKLFEVFQSIGIKFGQLASTYRLFGEEIAEKLNRLKSNVLPLSKFEAESIINDPTKLDPKERARIKRVVKVIGSASMKTVFLVELNEKDSMGRNKKVAMLLQRPFIGQQIEGNVKLSEAFLKQAQKNGVPIDSDAYLQFLEDSKWQLKDEIKITEEAKHIREAKSYYEKFNRKMRLGLKGYHFEIADLVNGFTPRNHLLFLDLASGVPLSDLSKSEKEELA